MALDTIASGSGRAGLRIGIVRSRFQRWAGEALLNRACPSCAGWAWTTMT